MTQFRPFEWNTFDDSRNDRGKKATKKNWWASHLSRHTPRLFPTRLTFEAPEKDSFKRVVHYSKGFNLRNWCFFNESSNASSRGVRTRSGLDFGVEPFLCGLFSLNLRTFSASFAQLACLAPSLLLPSQNLLQICSCSLPVVRGSYVMRSFNVIKSIHNCTFYGFPLSHTFCRLSTGFVCLNWVPACAHNRASLQASDPAN